MRLPILVPSLLLSPMLLAQHPTETEPNDTAALANTITVATQVEAYLTAAEQDWFKFTLTSAQRVRLDTNGQDTRFTLFDASGTVPLALDDDARGVGNAWASSLWMNLTAGTYTVQVVGFDTTIFGPYSIEFATFPTKVYTSTEVEANDTYLTANVIPIPPGGAQVLGNIGPATTVLATVVPLSTIVYSDLVPATAIVASKSVSSSTTTVITPVGGGMTASAYIPAFAVQMTSGTNIGLIRPITANTATTITMSPAWPVANAPADTFDIITANTTTVTRATTALTASAYFPGCSLQMLSGLNIGQIRAITANTATTITTAAFSVPNSPGDLFDIITNASTTTVIQAIGLTPGAYIGGRYQIRFLSGANAGSFRQITANSATNITSLAFLAAPLVGDAFVVELVDYDFYQITLTAPRTGLWFMVTEGDAPYVNGTRYELYDTAGVLLLASSTTAPAYGPNVANSPNTTQRLSSIRVWPAGTYNIAIRPPTTATPPYEVLPSGNYCLELFADMTIGTGATVGENAEPNNTVATATPLTFGQRGTGNLTISTGADARDVWGPFTVPDFPCVVTFQSGRGTTTPIADTTVNLLTSTGAIAVAATTGNVLDWTSHGRTSVQFTGGGTYYVEVVSPGTSTTTQTGNYVMEISDIMAVPYQAASYTVVLANQVCGIPTPVLSDAVPATAIVASKSVTSSTTTVITPVGGGMTASAYIPAFAVQMTSGANVGLIRAITANSATTITTAAWPVANTAGDTFDIITANTTTVTRATAALTASAFIPNFTLLMTSGANSGLFRTITANSATTITTAAFPVANGPGDTFLVTAPSLGVALVGETPTLGALFSRNVNNCGAFGVGFLLQGLTNATASGGTIPLPYDMTPNGAPNCTINVDPLVTSLFVANGAGTAMLDVVYPSDISLRGLPIFEQAAVLNLAANALGLQVSNYARQIIGERGY